MQTLFPLRGNGAIRLTTARYYTPDGRSIQGQGITPDVVVHETDNPVPSFGPEHETDLNNTLKNGEKAAPPRPAVPLAADIPGKPPKDWPKYDPAKPDTDFQLQQALKLVTAMANAGNNGTLVAPADRQAADLTDRTLSGAWEMRPAPNRKDRANADLRVRHRGRLHGAALRRQPAGRVP